MNYEIRLGNKQDGFFPVTTRDFIDKWDAEEEAQAICIDEDQSDDGPTHYQVVNPSTGKIVARG